MMVEVPSSRFDGGRVCQRSRFFSIGTNDLVQYILAVDRGNELISGMFKEFHPAVLRAISKIVTAAHKNEIK